MSIAIKIISSFLRRESPLLPVNAHTFCHLRCAGLTLLAIALSGGRATVSDPYNLMVNAERLEDPSSEATQYRVVYPDWRSEDLIEPWREGLDAGLAQLGYEAVSAADATVLIHITAVQEHLIVGTQPATHREPVASQNPDSIRYKNVAAMIEGGRYPQLLNDNPNAPGEILLGPNGEWIATGSLRGMEATPAARDEIVFRKITALVLTAVNAPLPSDPADIKIRWRVEVFSEQNFDQPGPDMSHLVEMAIRYLAGSTGVPRRIKR